MSTQPEDKKKAANYYQGITAPGSPTYCGKVFSYFMGKHSLILRENSPTIYGNNGTTLETKR